MRALCFSMLGTSNKSLMPLVKEQVHPKFCAACGRQWTSMEGELSMLAKMTYCLNDCFSPTPSQIHHSAPPAQICPSLLSVTSIQRSPMASEGIDAALIVIATTDIAY